MVCFPFWASLMFLMRLLFYALVICACSQCWFVIGLCLLFGFTNARVGWFKRWCAGLFVLLFA